MNSDQRKEMDGPNYALADEEFDTDDSYPEEEGEDVVDQPDFCACPACGELIEFCQGHGEIGDYQGFLISQQHDNGDHSNCNLRGCEEANQK